MQLLYSTSELLNIAFQTKTLKRYLTKLSGATRKASDLAEGYNGIFAIESVQKNGQMKRKSDSVAAENRSFSIIGGEV